MCLAACPLCWSRGWWPTSPSPSPPSTSTCWTSRRQTRTQRIRFTSIYSRMPFLSRISNKIQLQWRFWSYLDTFTLLHWYFIFSVTPKLVDGFAWGLPSGALRKNARGFILCMYVLKPVILTIMWSSDKFSLGLLKDHKVIFTNPKLTNKVTYSDPKVTYIDPTHLLLHLPTSPGP